MKIYIAHNFAARDYLMDTVRGLEEHGHECTSTWIWDDSHILGMNEEQSALKDLEDIDRADTLILFIDQYWERMRKGEYFEFGYAVAKGKRVILIGKDTSCIFCHLPQLERFEYLCDFLV